MRKTLKILLYGDIDLNFIDGSAVWLTSLAHVLNLDKNIEVDLLLKGRIKNTSLTSELENLTQINVINTFNTYKDFKFQNNHRMNVSDAVKIMETLDSDKNYDCIIIRGFNLINAIMDSSLRIKTIPYCTEVPHKESDINEKFIEDFQKIYMNFPNMFVQTENMKYYLMNLLKVDGAKFLLMTPMIPECEYLPDFRNHNNALIYTGKFAKQWYIEELLDGFEKMYKDDPTILLNIAGEKFQGELIPKQEEIKNRFTQQKGVNWVGGLSRSQSMELIKESDVGYCWRSIEIDNNNSLELSTKLLEFGQLGKPVLLRRTRMHEELLGSDYELFIENEQDLISKSLEVMYDKKLYSRTAKKVYEVCSQFAFKEAYKRLKEPLWSFNKQKTKLLFAGHDLKFINMAVDYFREHEMYDVKVDQWTGHNKHNEEYSKECLEWADIIFCEWGLGNAVWYSKNKKINQKLFVRMHAQERLTEYPEQFMMNNIDRIIVISPYGFEEFSRICKIPREKMTIIYNMIDTEKLNKPKTVPAEELKFNIGICGILPSLKRMDKALNILKELWKKDKRYKLYVKGKMPQELSWLMNREEERKYYEELFSRINSEPWGKNVIFDGHGDDVAEWFRKIGYILSTSDYESFHLAPMEGMASGSIPLVLKWPGAETVYPSEYLFNKEKDICDRILQNFDVKNVNCMKMYPKQLFDKKEIIKQIEELFTR